MRNLFFTLLITSISVGQSFKDLTERPIYNPLKSTSKIVIDGDLSEQDWLNAQVATDFTDRGFIKDCRHPIKRKLKLLMTIKTYMLHL